MHNLALNHKGQKSLAWKENFENNNYAKGTVIFDNECIIPPIRLYVMHAQYNDAGYVYGDEEGFCNAYLHMI